MELEMFERLKDEIEIVFLGVKAYWFAILRKLQRLQV